MGAWTKLRRLHGADAVKHPKDLGSENGVTNWVGSENGEELFNPLGVPWATVGSPVIWSFAGFEHGHTDIMQWPGTFREYDPNKRRWLTPDPLGGGDYESAVAEPLRLRAEPTHHAD
jgi:hypothetical protein